MFFLFVFLSFLFQFTNSSTINKFRTNKLVLKGKLNSYVIHAVQGDHVIGASISKSGFWEDQIHIDSFLKKMNFSELKNCIDLGANIGSTLIQMIDSGCKEILAIEPVFTEVLNMTIFDNNLEFRVKIVDKAVGKSKGEAIFKVNTRNPGGTKISKSRFIKNVHMKKVNVETFSSILEKNKVYEFIKIDIEGDERYCYESVLLKMKLGIIKSALIEIHWVDNESINFLNHYAENGFKIVDCRSMSPVILNQIQLGSSFKVCIF